RVDKVSLDCAEAVSEVISEDTKLPSEEAMLLAVGLCGMAQITARYWLGAGQQIPRDAAAKLISSLSW
ncbi:TetR family transcriptional regulator, partial [Streptomyces nanshensis]